jgi:hypothetical protein
MNRVSGLMSHLIASLSPNQRAERYRHYAAETITMAQVETNPDRRTEYLTLAASWHSLAVEAERLSAGLSPDEATDGDEHSEETACKPH